MSIDAAKAEWVSRVLGVAMAPPALPAAQGAVAYAKSRLLWLGTRRSIDAEVAKLAAALTASYAREGIGAQIGAAFAATVAPVMDNFDESLADTLDAAVNETDAAKRAALVAEARATIQRYQDYLATETLLPKLDGNPLVPMSIVATMTRTLQALSVTIR